jgi:hypothetical protein
MPAIIRKDVDQTWDPEGNLVSEEVVDRDVTVEVVHYDLHAVLRGGLEGRYTLEELVDALSRLVLMLDDAFDVAYDHTSPNG